MQTINVINARYYIAETAIPDIANNRVRVYDFGYGTGTVCNISSGGSITCEAAYNHARNGTAIVYVPLNTPTNNNSFTVDNDPLNKAIAIFAIAIVGIWLIGKN